jgi:hypothetical protein
VTATNPYSPPTQADELRHDAPRPIPLEKAILRWVLVPFASAGGFCLAYLLGLVAWSMASAWVPWAEGAVVLLGVALAAVLMVVLGTRTAPSHRAATAWFIFAGGTLLALGIASTEPSGGLLLVAGAAIVAGLVATLMLSARYRVSTSSPARSSTPHP